MTDALIPPHGGRLINREASGEQAEALAELARWTEADVWAYIVKNDVPYNPLHDQSYPSLGCTYCTKAVQPGDDPRSGRWQGFDKTECGLHVDGPVLLARGEEITG